MKMFFHTRFLKHYQKRVKPFPHLDSQYEKRFKLFFSNRQNPLLKDHALGRDLKGYRAFSITGDIRVIYSQEKDVIQFYDVGSHNQVYK